jgi:hypothetical protein
MHPASQTTGGRLSQLGSSVTVEQLDADPHPVLARLRAHEPVSWLPSLDGWLITRHDLALEAMRDSERFTVDDPRFSTAQVVGPSMLSSPPAAGSCGGPSPGRRIAARSRSRRCGSGWRRIAALSGARPSPRWP